ncbi:butyrophilin subfamily 3 member A1-like [Esox lucius]|uniref:butyrophilin subfamily 3 member A1-like n=1 Tax=Esox lucius TaxID=8010 RepID=UPI0014773B29|nr:butyrophilin subfamily 3 member A1-like [Esox lucius]
MAGHQKTETRHSVLSLMVMLLAALTVPLAAQSPEVFSLTTPDGPVGTRWNSSVTLPCELSPLLNAEPLEVRWYRPDNYNTHAFLYKDHNIQKESMDIQYRDRASLAGGLERGNVSLRLERITLEDRGEYVCQVTSKQWYEKASVFLTVNADGGGGQVHVTCSSEGWSPQPILTWKNKQGTEITNGVEVQKNMDSQGLVSVSSWLLYSPSDSDWISCTVSLSEENLEGRILPRVPTQENWRSAFITILIINVLVVFVVIGLFFWNKKTEFLTFKKNPNTNDETESKGDPTALGRRTINSFS